MFMLEIVSLNKLYARTKMHVDVHVWNCIILLDSKNKLCAKIEMMLMSLLEFRDGNKLQHDFVTIRVIKMKQSRYVL